jgi:hypothetical protein
MHYHNDLGNMVLEATIQYVHRPCSHMYVCQCTIKYILSSTKATLTIDYIVTNVMGLGAHKYDIAYFFVW